jgi:SAM-dependent methyltransferase/ketosteroid isomerase-like protein
MTQPDNERETGDFLAEVLPRQLEAGVAIHNGDAGRWTSLWSQEDPVTLFGARVSRTGATGVAAFNERLGAWFRDCSSYDVELVAGGASGDLGYTVAYEKTTAAVKGAPAQPYTLRVTHIYRREAGVWRIVHRHGDGVPDDPATPQTPAGDQSAAQEPAEVAVQVGAPDYALVLSEAEVQRYQAMAARARVDEADAWERAGIRPGASIADVGCGPGAALVAMAAVVGPTGSAVGVDADPVAVRTADQLIKQTRTTWARAALGRADDTGLELDDFDVAVMRHVLAHNGGAEQAIVRHLAELVRPGGCVYLVDADLTALRMLDAEPDAVELSERYASFHRSRGNDPQTGLRLGKLLQQSGLELLEHRGSWTIMPVPAGFRPPAWAARDAMVQDGIATVDDLDRWQTTLERMDRCSPRPTIFMPTFTAIGRRTR